MFQKGGRNDLVEKEQAELKVLQRFLPEPLTDEEIKTGYSNCDPRIGCSRAARSWKVSKE